ncbi:unnamed protein product [Discula destructiva]
MVTTRSSSRSTPATPLPTRASLAGNALEIDPVSKARTITHMNNDHGDDMVAILRHYAGLTEAQAAGAKMEDLDLATMSIRANTGLHAVLVEPPMASWGDRRARIVDMTLAARKALGIDGAGQPDQDHAAPPAAVQLYLPEGVGVLSFAGVMWYFVSAAVVFSGNMQEGSLFWRLIQAAHFPQGPELYRWLVEIILLPMLAIHIAEAVYMAKSRLAPKGVPAGSKMWWLWVVCAFFEGAPCWQKWDRRVLGKQKGE